MSKSDRQNLTNPSQGHWFATHQSDEWLSLLKAVQSRFNREYLGENIDLPPEVEAMPIFQEKAAGTLQEKLVSPFWEIAKPKKNWHCLALGCGVSFLIYPWRDWEAFFYGQDICSAAQELLNSRGPQLNSKLFRGVKLGPAHELQYEDGQFDLAIATGFSCYYPLDYWAAVLQEVKRVLKPGGQFVFDVLDVEQPLAENWAILETYLGAEVFLESLGDWEKTIKSAGAKILKRKSGELLKLYKVSFSS